MIPISWIIHMLFGLTGFLFLFRIKYCTGTITKANHKTTVSLIIPARNEEKNLPNLLTTLKNQVPLPDEIIVVDDHSEDNTKKIAEKYGALVIRSQSPPEGWTGKNWACYQGYQQSTGEILVFLDADTFLEKDGLAKIIHTYLSDNSVISIQPFHKMVRFYEQFSAFFNIVLMAAMGSFTILGNRVQPIGLFGPAMVLTRKQYEASGGHKKIKGELLDDLAYGNTLKRAKIPIDNYGGKNTISFRMYPDGIRELINGWSKGFAMGASKTSLPVLILIIIWIIGAIGSTRYLLQNIAGTEIIPLILWALLYLFFVAQIFWMLRRIGNFKIYTALFYPIPLLFFILVFAYSFISIFIKRNVRWKGREIDLKTRNE